MQEIMKWNGVQGHHGMEDVSSSSSQVMEIHTAAAASTQRRCNARPAHFIFVSSPLPLLETCPLYCSPHSLKHSALRTQFIAAMWASNASRLALLTCPNRAPFACTLFPSFSFLSHANLTSSTADSWRRTSTARLVRVRATADLDSGAGAVEVEEPVKIDRRASDWKKAEKVTESGSIHRGRVDACNSGGLLVRFGSLQGFLPFSQMDIARLPRDGKTALYEVVQELVGEIVSVKMIEVNEAERRLIFSEKLAILEENLRLIEEGSIYDGKVNSVTDFGAFVDLVLPYGTSPVSGLVHISELSWDPVRNPRDLLEEGQNVRVKVLQVDKTRREGIFQQATPLCVTHIAKDFLVPLALVYFDIANDRGHGMANVKGERMRLALSIKQLEADPLLETLDTLMPAQTRDSSEPVEQDAELLGTSLPGLEQICEELLNEEGINGVTLGRTRLEKRVVSQDLELWLANAPVEDGKFNLLARAGRQVQEVQLNTNLDREGIKAAVQRVTRRVP